MSRTKLTSLLIGLTVVAVLFLFQLIGSSTTNTEEVAAPAPRAPADDLALEALLEDEDLDPKLVAVLQSLAAGIEAARESQRRLESELADVRRLLGVSGTALGVEVLDEPGLQTDAAAAGAEPATEPPLAGPRRRRALSQERLEEAGFSSLQAREVIERVDGMALERLELRYQAAREGWLNSPEYREAIAELPNTRQVLESEYGADAYDRYLYASGRPNRVVVRDVYQGSAAEQAGLQPGDVLMEMADQRVYRTEDLMNIATRSGSSSTVPLVVKRDGELVGLYVTNGPLGIRARRGYEAPTVQ